MDLLVLIIYFVLILGIGIHASRNESLEDFFVNSRRTRSPLLIFTIMATVFGGGATVGLVGRAYEQGIISFIFGLCFSAGIFFAALLAGHIKRFGDKHKCYTVSDFLAVRYSKRCKLAGGIIYLFVSLFLMAAQFIALSTFIHVLLGWPMFISTVVSAFVIIF